MAMSNYNNNPIDTLRIDWKVEQNKPKKEDSSELPTDFLYGSIFQIFVIILFQQITLSQL